MNECELASLDALQYLHGAKLIDHPDLVPWGGIDVGYFDCNWQYRVRSRKGLSRSAENHYDTLSIEELGKLPINELLSKNAWLFAWVTLPTMFEARDMIEHCWGLHYATTAFVWAKRTSTYGRKACKPLWHVGTGHYTRANTELCLLFKKGKGLPRQSKSVRQLVEWPVSKVHSEKPKGIYHDIFRLAEGDHYDIRNLQYTYMEAFARNFWPGYMSMGRDLPNKDQGPDIRWLLGVQATV